MAFPFALLIDPLARIIDKIIPDPEAAAKAKAELLKEDNRQELNLIQIQLSAIMAEAQSNDPWTSRARPMFLYVMYFMIMMAVPMGILHVFRPDMASGVATGMQLWLNAIPGELYALFGAGYLGYTGMRTIEKSSLNKSMKGRLPWQGS